VSYQETAACLKKLETFLLFSQKMTKIRSVKVFSTSNDLTFDVHEFH